MVVDWRGKPFYFEDYQVGQQHPTETHFVDKAEIISFAEQWDPQPWHVDEAAAKKSMFGGLTACSAHIFALFSMISPKWASGAVQQPLASLGFDAMQMHKPLYAGDTIHCISHIELARRSRSKPDRGIVASRVEMVNQHGDKLFSVLATFIIASDPGPRSGGK